MASGAASTSADAAIANTDFARGEKNWDTVAPTAEPMAEGHIVPRQLSITDLVALKGHWVDAAKRALEAGFEVLEIHNAHGYLMHQFLSPLSNKRDDAYGGDFAGRREILSRERQVNGFQRRERHVSARCRRQRRAAECHDRGHRRGCRLVVVQLVEAPRRGQRGLGVPDRGGHVTRFGQKGVPHVRVG